MPKQTTIKEKLTYSAAAASDSVAYMLVTTFFLFFLTTVADIEPGIAGLLIAIAAVWNAIFNPVVGFFSDRITSKYGRRRPLLFASAIPLALMTTVLFTDVPLDGMAKPIYYGFALLMYWSIFDIFFVPFYALGANYTSDYQDRTVLRLFASFFNLLGTMIAMAMPTLFVGLLEGAGMTTEHSWTIAAATMGSLMAIGILITAFGSAKFDPPNDKDGKESERNAEEKDMDSIRAFFRQYLEIARLKPMRSLIIISLFALISYVIFLSDIVYLMTYNMHFSAGRVSFFMMLRVTPSMLFIPIVGKLIKRFDKKKTLIGFYLVGSICMILLRCTFQPTLPWVLIYLFFSSMCTAVYWQVVPGMYYDVCDYDRIHTGHRREAAILSFQGTVEAVAEGLGTQILGLTLQFAGFHGESAMQTDTALCWILNGATVLPVMFLVVVMIATWRYPLNKKKFEKMLKEYEANKEEAEVLESADTQ